MMESILEVGLLVVAGGHLAVITGLLSDGRLEVEIQKDRSRIIVPVDEIEVISSQNIKDTGLYATRVDVYQELEQSPEATTEAFRRFEVFKNYSDGRLTLKQAADALEISVSRVYQLLQDFDEGLGVASVLARRRGRKKGSILLSGEQNSIIESCGGRKN